MIDGEIDDILKWVSAIDPQTRHQDIRLKRMKGTGDWFLRTKEFQTWSKDEAETCRSSILGCFGIPGSGKPTTWYAKISESTPFE